MAEKELKIQITAAANVAGAKQAEDALHAVKDAAQDAEAAADKATATEPGSAGVPEIPAAEITPAKDALDEVDEAARNAAEGLRTYGEAVVQAGENSAAAAGEIRETADAIRAATEEAGKKPLVSIDASKQAAEAAKEVKTAVQQVEEAAKDAAKQPVLNPEAPKKAVRSIKELEEELVRLKGELREAEIGSDAFEATSKQIGKVERDLSDAASAAKAFGRSANEGQGPTRNLGGAVLELSRAVEDAQYGLRGVQNNLPGLVTMLGGSAGLAGVISLAAVAAGLLGPKLFGLGEDADKPKDRINGLREILKGLDADLGKIRAAEADLAGGGVKAFEDRKAAIDRDIAAVNGYIEALKSVIKHEGEMLKFRFRSDLDAVDSKQRKGELTPEEADKQRTEIKTRMQQDELERLKLLDDADAKAFQAKLELLKKQEENANQEKAAAEQALQNREEQIKLLKREVLARQQLETQIQTLSDLAKKIPEADKLPFLQEDEIRRMRELASQPIVDQGPANQSRNQAIEAAQAMLANLERFNGLMDQIAEMQREIAAKAPRPITDLKLKDENGEERTIPSVAKREKERLENGVEGELPSLAKLKENVTTFGNAAESAAQRVKDAEQLLNQKQQSNTQEDTQRRDVAATENPVLREVEQTAAGQVEELMQRILDQIPNAANDPAVQAVVNQIKDLEKGGVQQAEMEEARQGLVRLSSMISADNSQRATLFGQINNNMEAMLAAMRDVATAQRAIRGQIDEVRRDVNDWKQRP